VTVVVALQDRLPDVAGIDRWLYAGQDAAWRIAAERGALAAIPRLDTADALQRKAWELRKPFLAWCADLARRNDSLEWWGSQLAARNSYTRFYDRVCALAVALDAVAVEDGTLLVVCESPAQACAIADATGVPAPERAFVAGRHPRRNLLRAWARFAPQPLRDLPGRLSAGAQFSLDVNPRYRRRVLAGRGLLGQPPFTGPRTALLFTWVDRRSFAPDGSYRDPHLGPLPRLLRERGYEVAFLARVLHSIPFAEAVRRLAATGERVVFPDAYLELDDERDTARRAGAFFPEIPEDATVAGVPVAGLAREFVEEQRPTGSGALIIEALVRRLAEAGVRPERIVYTAEGHDWELVLARAAGRHLPEAQLVAYDNLNMSRLGLSMFPAPGEPRPLPDRIVTNGEAFRDVLAAEGLPAELVRVGCGLRHETLWDEPRAGTRARPLRVLVATEIVLGPSAELVEKALAAFAGDDRFELVVKAHPLLVRSQLPQAGRLRFDDAPMLELLQRTDVLLYTYTAVAFEALAVGVPPVHVRMESTLDLDQLEFAPELRWEARTPEQLRSAVEEIAALDEAALADWRARARAAAQRALAPVQPECVEAFL